MSTAQTSVRLYEPGRDITAEPVADVTAKHLLKIAGDRAASGNISVTTAAAGDRTCGVAATDAATGKIVRVARGGVVKIVASGSIAAGAEVQAGANGTVTTLGAGVAVGYVLTSATDGGDAEVALY